MKHYLDKASDGTPFAGKLPTKRDTVDSLRKELMFVKEQQSLDEPIEVDEVINVEDSAKPDDWMDLVQSLIPTVDMATTATSKACDELEEYLALPYLLPKSSKTNRNAPLHFWHEHATKFPYLAIIARRYLGMPASSGSVERLFSIAGAIARSRRAKINVETVEKLLCLKDSYGNKTF